MNIRYFPQRLAAIAPPGALLKRLDGIRKVVRLENAERDPVYLARVQQMPCLCCGMEPPPSNDAAHIRMSSAAHGKRGGIGKKPADKWALPLCGGPGGCHAEQHDVGEMKFWHAVGLNPLYVAGRLYAARSDLVAMRAVIMTAIAERK
jgi:hypothetical protein